MKKGFVLLPIIVLLLVLIGTGAYLYFRNIGKSPQNIQTNIDKVTPTPISNNNSDKAIIQPINLDDKETVIYYGEGKSLYKYTLDGEPAKKILDFEDNILKVKFVPFTKDLFIQTSTKNFLLKENSSKPDLIFDDNSKNKPNIPENKIVNNKLTLTTFNKLIYPEDSGNGVNIIEDMLDGTSPKKIGVIKGYDYWFPAIISSYSGEYLLNDGTVQAGGTLGRPALVVSGDGTKHYPIDFDWFVSSAVWISGNQLLTSSQSVTDKNGVIKGPKLFTIKSDGTFTTEDAPYIQCQLNQNYVSPSKDYLILDNSTSSLGKQLPKLELLNLKDKTKNTIDQLGGSILGWNNKADKIFYNTDKVTIYDIKTMKNYKLSRGLGNIAPNLIGIY